MHGDLLTKVMMLLSSFISGQVVFCIISYYFGDGRNATSFEEKVNERTIKRRHNKLRLICC